MTGHVSKTRGPWSIATSFLYLVPAGFLVARAHPLPAAAFVLLWAGTLLFHATDRDYGLDGAGMLASTFVLIALPFDWGLELVLALVGFWLGRFYYSHKMVGASLVPVSLICLTHHATVPLLIGLLLFGAGFLIWRREGDWAHAAWHIATSAAMTSVVLGLT